MTAENQLPYDQGYDAALGGQTESENPYAPDDWRHKEWVDGFAHVIAAAPTKNEQE